MKPVTMLLLGLAAFGTGWLIAPSPPDEPALVQPRKQVWRLPDLLQRPDQASRAIGLASSPIFEPEAALIAAAQAAAAAQAEDKRWRVAGIFGRGNERKVLITFVTAGKPPLRLGVGDKVPSGQRITRISDGEVLIRDGKQQLPLGAGYRE